MLRPLLIFLVVASLLAGILYFGRAAEGPLKVSGFVESDEIRVGSRVGGRVRRVPVDEGDVVSPGTVLLEFEPFDLDYRVSVAASQLAEAEAEFARLKAGFRAEEVQASEARVAQAEAQLEKLVNGPRPEEIRAAENLVAEARAKYDLSLKEHRRAETLASKGTVTQDMLDVAVSALQASRATTQAREEQLAVLKQGTRAEELAEARARLAEVRAEVALRRAGYRTEDVAKAEAARDAASSALQALKVQQRELTVTATDRAVVDAVDLEPGDLVGANVPALSLITLQRLRVRAYVPENRLDIRDGQKAWVTVDSFPGERFAAHVTFVSRQAEFTPRNVQTVEERSKQVFRIRVTLDEGHDRLRPGMAADVSFDEPDAAGARR
jgi:multidrug resistance efflux pump